MSENLDNRIIRTIFTISIKQKQGTATRNLNGDQIMTTFKPLSRKQLQRNNLQLALTYHNALPEINRLFGEKGIGDPHGAIHVDGREPQNKGMRQFQAYGTTKLCANRIFSFNDVEKVYKFLVHSIDFAEDLRLKPQRAFEIGGIRILFVHAVDSSNRPLAWEWVNWDGENHKWIFAHNESLSFEQTVEAFKAAIAKIATPGEYNICGLPVYVRPEDMDFVPKKGMNYNLRKVLSAINHKYVGANNWAE